MNAELTERVNELYEQADAMARELNLRNEAMARIENAMSAVMSISRTIRQSEDGLIFIGDSEIEGVEDLIVFVKRVSRPSKLTPIAPPKKPRKKSNAKINSASRAAAKSGD
ncbi:hypothetical protein [Caudoviricetes sp.]|nr:hypothetical protein [Caudoviricetes sp.]